MDHSPQHKPRSLACSISAVPMCHSIPILSDTNLKMFVTKENIITIIIIIIPKPILGSIKARHAKAISKHYPKPGGG